MTNVVILHGTFGKPFENWFPWLEAKLSMLGVPCIVPQFPTPTGQSYENWKRLLDYYRKLGLVAEETILVGHSTGAVFAAKYLLDSRTKVRALVSVAGYNGFESGNPAFDHLNRSFFVDPSELPSVQGLVGASCSYISDNDPYLPTAKLQEFGAAIGGRVEVVKNAGHFNESAGYRTFPRLMEWLSAEGIAPSLAPAA